MARPRTHDRQAITAAICAAVAEGGLVKDACQAHGITRGQLHRWCEEDQALRDAYTRARADQAHAIAEEALTIADSEVATSEEVQRNRLRVDTRKWLASKIAPRLYGEKLDVTSNGETVGQPQAVVIGGRTIVF